MYMIVIASLFITAPNWKKHRHLSTGKWLNKLWYFTVESSLGLKRSIVEIHSNLDESIDI
jgi:hypothetical protein